MITVVHSPKKIIFYRIIMLITASSLFFSKSNSQTFLNGNFESNNAGVNQINMTNPAFNAAMANTFAFGSYGDMDIITNGTWGPPQNGSWYVGLTGGGTDIITMKISAPLTAGNSYTIIFYDRGYSGFPVYPIQLGLSTVNNAVGTIIYTGPVPTMGVWSQRTVTFIAPNNGQYISVLMTAGSTSDWVNVDNFTFANSLPVELISFTGEVKNRINELYWTTASEINNDFFDVERSDDGKSFFKIGRIEGSGNSNQIINYSFKDKNFVEGINYYRLKQVDYNGEFSYSNVIAVNSKVNENSCFVSPSTQNGIYSLHYNETGNGIVKVFDLAGNQIILINAENDLSEIKIDLSNYCDGMYVIRIINGEKIQSVKLIKN